MAALGALRCASTERVAAAAVSNTLDCGVTAREVRSLGYVDFDQTSR